jgi:hypothetical protein
MRQDDSVQEILKTGVGAAGFYGVAAALYKRSEGYIAEARVFVRGSTPKIEAVLQTIRIEAEQADPAIALLENKIAERFGSVKWLYWAKATHTIDG